MLLLDILYYIILYYIFLVQVYHIIVIFKFVHLNERLPSYEAMPIFPIIVLTPISAAQLQ